ncbi:hypothetical protein HWV62_43369 [Athelia sp. TMB]|nr:hypothetical protein HWV62_43369 [Athelia sp. TMB]
MSHPMLSTTAIAGSRLDIRAIGDLQKNRKISKADHFVILKIDGKKVFESAKLPCKPTPQWKEQMTIQFTPSTAVDIAIYRQSRWGKWAEHVVAECSALGIDFLDIGTEQVLIDKSGKPCLAVKFDLLIQAHLEFMKDVDKQMAQLEKVKGVDAAQALTTIGTKIGTVLLAIVPILDQFSDAHPILKVTWIILSSAIKMAQDQKKQDDNVRDLVESLREMAGAASSCPHLRRINGTTDVIKEIGKVSLEVAMLVHDYVNPSIRGHTKFLESAIHVWMKSPDISPNYNAARKKHQAGTGSWFLNGSQFSEWKRSGSVLWLYGGPGCGKTILCSSVIEKVIVLCRESASAQGYAYFFFDGTRAQSETSNYDQLIRSIITQLSDRCDDQIPDVLVDMYNQCDQGHRQPLESQLETTLARILKSFESTYIIIDSLDECIEKTDLLKWIQSVAKESSVHLMLTSRPEPEVERGLAPLSNLQKVSVGEFHMSDDISTYLEACLQAPEMDQWDQEEKEMITDALISGSDGMIRWVSLQVDAVKKCKSKTDLQNQLNSLPKGLDQTYAQIFQRSENPEKLQTLLQWLAFSKRPMTVAQLAEVLVVDFQPADGPLYNRDRRYKQPAAIWSDCYGLVTEFDGTVKLTHFTVKEYFIQYIKSVAETQLCTSEQFSHCVITQTCLAHLLYFDGPSVPNIRHLDSGDRDNIDSLFPLARYAAKYWVTHLRSSGAGSTNCHPLRQLLIKFFQSPPTSLSSVLVNWVQLHNLVDADGDESWMWRGSADSRRYIGPLPPDAPPLYYACLTGSMHTVQHMIHNNADVNAESHGAMTRPLLAALWEGHLEIAQLLFENGADPNVKEGFHGTVLHAASSLGYLEIVKLLLDNGANVNIVGGFNGTALQAASMGGHLEVSQLLLSKGADVDTMGGRYGTAQNAAYLYGHSELAELLRQRGDDESEED